MVYATLTKTGGRQVNEDSVGVRQKSGSVFCILADGLGGHGAGEVASNLVVNKALNVFDEGGVEFNEILSVCMNEGQKALIEEQNQQNCRDDMKTTAAMLLIENGKAQWAHIGDSRIYRFENMALTGRTIDHSVPQMLVLQGEICEKDIRHHEDRNRLTRVLGVQGDILKYTLSEPVDLQEPAAFLLCSDGFWELIEEKYMIRLLNKNSSPEEWLTGMEKIIIKNGRKKNMDNYSAIAVYI